MFGGLAVRRYRFPGRHRLQCFMAFPDSRVFASCMEYRWVGFSGEDGVILSSGMTVRAGGQV